MPDRILKSLLFVLLLAGILDSPVQAAQFTMFGYGLDGYDAVAYFTDNIATRGNDTLYHRHDGALWLFTSKENRNSFATDPQRYMPAFDGYCVFCLSENILRGPDPRIWSMYNNQLFLHGNQEMKEMFDRDPEQILGTARDNWEVLRKTLRNDGNAFGPCRLF